LPRGIVEDKISYNQMLVKKIVLAIIMVSLVQFGFAQNKPILKPSKKITKGTRSGNDSISKGTKRGGSKKNIKNKEAKITDYLLISNVRDTTYVDTTLSIRKEYKYNYLRKDNFNRIAFANLGQTYNTLSENVFSSKLMPTFAGSARHFNYMEIEDINYYHVPTPLTELFYKTAFTQGQLLDAFFSVNTSPQLNISIGYKGLRSLGKYQHALTSTGNFRFITSYKTKNKRYRANAHVVMQDLLNRENGGLKDSNIEFFQSGAEEFNDRGVLEVNFENAENTLIGKRFHLDHGYTIIKKTDSLSANSLSVNHIMSFEDKYYQYDQALSNPIFGIAFRATELWDKVTLEHFHNQVQLNYSNKTIGVIQFNASHDNYNYGYNKIVLLGNNDNIRIPNRLKGDNYSVGGKYQKQIKGFNIKGDIGTTVSGNFDGNYLKGEASYKLNPDLEFSAQINYSSRVPSYNTLLYQSDYINYNWSNNFKNVKTQQLAFQVKSSKWLNLSVDLSTINDYVYFKKSVVTDIADPTQGLVKPFQNDMAIAYLRVKANKEIRYKNLALDNTIMYQSVDDANNTLNVPEIITRNTLYYSNHVFKKALYFQTGVIFNYFTSYNMNAYDSVLAEFYTQNEQNLGGFPRLDLFLNAKVRQTRIYFKAEHFNASFTGFDYFSAPNYPYRDFTVRFGLVWNFFL